ncbi:GNAT family N-acetyltransferase (plasmid) [Embleya sp. NBC_00888]|uniref:GNAT family N-acetyltransferase n=1 Tax=Embleya sp. NBC_00888 TaxID=2975960 RepID=UPI002F909416|nr:GNAT family N-acetyltransferase [Embleya sp. NBC_00888]
MLRLREIAEIPSVLTWGTKLPDGSRLLVRPLGFGDMEGLAGFLEGLSPESRRFSTFGGYDVEAAREMCAAIARFDKLRLVLETPTARIVGLLEFSLALTDADVARYRAAGIRLAETDCRFGPTLADDHQGHGVGTAVFPFVREVARRLARTRIILWGGVLTDNRRAIRFYEKTGFRPVGTLTGTDGTSSLDMILDLLERP